ncbi:MAG: zinc finger MYND domain-containing protein [Candidatus Pacebacteria bacterium]|nr:zinc finger MYND domain-containing protein [Candidatus Paceibacterota bacterium]
MVASYRPTKFDDDFAKYNSFLDLVNNAIVDIEKKMVEDMYAAAPKIPHTDPLLFGDNYYVDFTDSKNRRVRARRNISKGELLLSVKPIVASLDVKNYQKRCHYCFKKSAVLKECSMCHFAMYCHIDCQRAHWSEHRLLCGIIKKSSGYINARSVPSLVYIVSTLYWKLHNINVSSVCAPPVAPEVRDLFQERDYPGHADDCLYVRECELGVVPSQLPSDVRSRYVELAYLMVKFNQLQVAEANMLEFFEFLCRIHGNLFSVCNEEYEYFATALYFPSVSYLFP